MIFCILALLTVATFKWFEMTQRKFALAKFMMPRTPEIGPSLE